MSDLTYNARQYVKFTADEFIAIIITSVCIALAMQMRSLLFEHFGEAVSYQQLAFMFVFALFVMLVIVYACKIVAIRLGQVITYRAHLPGLLVGIIITFVSAGYLPIFLPGGFTYEQPERMSIGKLMGFHKAWETGLIAGSFPLFALLLIIIISPLYLATGASLYFSLIIACCLIAIYACIPLPFIERTPRQNFASVVKSLRGATFGLDVVYSSRAWYFVLCVTVIFFAIMAYLLTLVEVRVGILLYAFSFIVGLLALYVYSRFFKK
jgi:hypothetical protein